MEHVEYPDKRSDIKSGDLLVWSNYSNSTVNYILLSIVRYFTMSEYAHVGIAMWDKGRLYVVEAVYPKITANILSESDSFYHIPMKVEWKEEYYQYLKNKIGERYSFIEVFRSYFNIKLKDNKQWQCVELANKFYKLTGYYLGEEYTPSKFVNNILRKCNTTIQYIKT